MGIKDLSKLIKEKAPEAVSENDIKNMFGRKIAIDASMALYQFLIAVRSQDGAQLTNADGDTTSHLMGMFYRTIRMVDNGIKPCYVFDGAPPKMKSDELAKRGVKRAEATKALDAAVEAGDQENVERFSKRTVKVTREHNEECQKLLGLMGIPFVNAPCEAEAQCAALAKAGKVYGVGTEDMDTITFAAPVLLRHLTFSEAKKAPIQEFYYDKILAGLDMNQAQFIDLCILLGCDYCDSIRGIGPKKAYELVTEHKSIEKILETLDTTKYPVPEDWPYKEARELFLHPDVTDPADIELKWSPANEEGIVDFLVKDKGFSEERIRSSLKKLQKAKSSSTQGRLDGFFSVLPKTEEQIKAIQKRKAEEEQKAKDARKKKGGASGSAKKGTGKPRK